MSFEETDVEIAEKDYGESGVKDVADDTGGVHPVVLAAVFGYFIVAFIVAIIVVQWTHICKQPTPSKRSIICRSSLQGCFCYPYIIQFVTVAGTKSSVYFTVNGDKGRTHEYLVSPAPYASNNFDTKSVVSIVVHTAGNIGDIIFCEVELVDKVERYWYLKYINVIDPVKKKLWYLPYHRWLVSGPNSSGRHAIFEKAAPKFWLWWDMMTKPLQSHSVSMEAALHGGRRARILRIADCVFLLTIIPVAMFASMLSLVTDPHMRICTSPPTYHCFSGLVGSCLLVNLAFDFLFLLLVLLRQRIRAVQWIIGRSGFDIPVGISHQGYPMAGQGADYYAPGGERPFPPPLQPKVSQESYASYQETASMHTRGVTYEDQQPTKTYSKTYKSSDPRSTLVMVAAGDLNPSEAIWPLPESLTGKSLAKMGAERDYGRTDQSGDAHCPCIHSTKAEMGQHTVRIQSYGNFGNPPPQPPAPPDVNDSCPCVKPTRSFPEARSLFHRSLDDRVGEMRYPAFRQQSRPPSGAATPARQLQPSSAVITRSDRYSGRYSPTHAGSETLYPSSVTSAHRQHAGRVANMYRPSVNRTNYAPPPVANDEYLKRIHDGPGLEALRDPNAAASRPDSRPAAKSGDGSGKGGKGSRSGGKTVRTKSPTPSPPTVSSPQSVSPTPSGASRGRPEVKKMTASSKHPASDGDTSKPTTEGHTTSGATSPEPSSKQPATAVPILPPPPHPPPPPSVPAETKKSGDAKAGGAKNAPGASKGGKAKDTGRAAKGKKPAGGEKPGSKPKSSSPSKKGGEAKSSPQSAKKGGGKKPVSKSPSPKGGGRKSKSKSPPPKGAKSKSSSRPSSPDGKGKGKPSGKGGVGGGEKQKATVGVAMFDDNVALLRSLIPYSQPVDGILRDLDTKNGASDIWWKRADVGDLQHKKTMNTTLNDPGSIRQLEKGDQSNSIDGVINENLELFERSWQPGTLKSSASSLPVSKKREVSAAAKASNRPSRRQGSRSQPEIATREQLEKPSLAVNKSSLKSSGRNKRVAANQSPCTDEVTKQIQQLRDAFMTNSRLNDTRSREAVIDDMHAQIVRASQTVKSEKARGITEKLAAGNLSNMIKVLGNMLDSSPTSPSAAGSRHSGVSASTARSRDQDTHGYSSDASSNANLNTNANTSNVNSTSTSSTTGSISNLLPALQLVSRDELTTLTYDDVENIARASLLAVVAEDASFCAIQNLIATSPSILGGGERALSDEDANASNNVHRQNQSLKPSSSSAVKVTGRTCTHPNHANAAHTLTKQVYCGLCIYVMMTNSVLLIRKVLLDSVACFNDAIWTRSIAHVETRSDANDVKTKSHQLFHNVQFHSLAVHLLTMIVSEMQRLHCKRCPMTTGTTQQQQRKAGKWGGKEATSDDDEEESDGECTECKLFSMYDAKSIAVQMAQRPCCPYLIMQVFTKAHELLRDVMSSFDVQRLVTECDTESMVDFVSSLHTALQRDEAVTKQDDIRDSVYALVMKEAAQFVAADLERLDDSRQRMTSTSTTSHDFKPDVDIVTQVAYNEFCSELEDFISTSDDD